MRWLVALFLLFSTGCTSCKGDPEKCEQMCRNYAELDFWDKANQEIEKLPVAERDAARKQKLDEYNGYFAKGGLQECTSRCVSANNTKDMDCVIAAKTAKAARACMNASRW